MGADIKQLRNRIKSVNSTMHLTKAMGLVASSKIRRAMKSADNAKEYFSGVQKAVTALCRAPEVQRSLYVEKPLPEGAKERVKVIVIAGDRGMAGGYNANIFRLMKGGDYAEIIPVGKRACDRWDIPHCSAEYFTVAEALELAGRLRKEYEDGEYDRLCIVSTEYVSMMSQVPRIETVLPLKAPEKQEGERQADVVFEPDSESLIEKVINEYISAFIIRCVRESFASENAARRMAMDSAGKNAMVMIDDLTLKYNRARQGAITQEITEIVAGAGEEE